MAGDFTLEGLQTAFAQSPFAISATVIVTAVTIAIILLYTEKPKTFLNANEFKPLTLTKIIDITHNTKKFVFSLPEPKMRIGLPTGQHITFLAKDEDGKDVYRPYTPVTDDDLPGAVEFVIKLYPSGKMSQVLSKMKVGDSMLMKGPRGKFQYARNMKKAIGMVAGGTGITPMYQVASAILKDPKDTTKISLIFGNLTQEDILIKQELDSLAAAHPDRFSVYYVLNTPPSNWSGGEGFISKAMIQQQLPAAGPEVMVLRCGPGPMNDAMKVHLDALGHEEANQFQF